jgi:hypothetical protein
MLYVEDNLRELLLNIAEYILVPMLIPIAFKIKITHYTLVSYYYL